MSAQPPRDLRIADCSAEGMKNIYWHFLCACHIPTNLQSYKPSKKLL